MKAGEIEALREQTVLDGAGALARRRDGAARTSSSVAGRCSRSATAAPRPTRWTSSPTSRDRCRRRRRGPARARSERRSRDRHRDRERHRAAGRVHAPGDRLRRRGRRADRVLDERRLAQRDRRARGGAPAGPRDDRARRLRRRPRGRGWAGRPPRRQPLAAHPAYPGGARDASHLLRELVEAGGARDRGAARVRARVEGVVQGVGFRPFVYRLAREERLGGLRAQRRARRRARGRRAGRTAVESFLARLAREAPPLAVVERVDCDRARVDRRARLPHRRERRARRRRRARRARRRDLRRLPAPSCATPADRRFRYPFINCTNCGPRFTIVRGVPYDRPATTMAGVRDVRRPASASTTTRATAASTRSRTRARPAGRALGCWTAAARRWHSRASALADAVAPRSRATRAAARSLAVKGIGGYHLACAAADERAVRELRARKRREDRPFALMVRDVAAAAALVELGDGRARAARRRARVRSCSRARRAGRQRRGRGRAGRCPSSA